jgi:hypothetical protein
MSITGSTLKTMVILGESPGDCWEWNGSKNKTTGYGKKTVNGKSVLAHRWVYEMLFGIIPEGRVVNHLCSNVSCVNPHHLEVVSQAENCRHGKGTKLDIEQVREIKAAKNNRRWGLGKELSIKYGVSSALIHDIWNDRAWRDVA